MRLYTSIIITSILATGGLGLISANATEKAPIDNKYLIKTVGEPKRCVSFSNIRSTKVVSERIVDFKMRGGKVYRNELPRKCGGMGPLERIAYRTATGSVCSTNTFWVLGHGGARNNCAWGAFQPIEKTRREKNEN